MSLAIESFARNSLAQFTQLYTELVAENGGDPDVANDFERKMWAKITGGALRGNRIPWNIVKKEIKIQLPYLPDVINYSRGCQALKKADGLYIPCGGKCVEETILCQSCTKTGAKYGQVEDRGAPGTYMDPEDKHEITYGTWLAKKDKTIEDVCSAIAEAGFEFTIPASYLAVNAKRVETKRRPGRPGAKKEVEESDDESVSSSISSKSAKSDKSDKPKAKKTKSDEEKPKAKPKKAKSDSEDEAPKKTKKAKSDSEDEAKTEKPKAKPKKKADTDSEDEAPKKKATKKAKSDEDEVPKAKAEKPKPKAKKAESDEPKKAKSEKPKPKAKKAGSDSEDEAPKAKAKPAPKKVKKAESGDESDTSKSKPKAKAEPEIDESQLAQEVFEEEAADEIIEIDGTKFRLRDESMVFNMEGEWVGKIEDGEVMWRE